MPGSGSELAFEYLALALEATRGTPVTPPTSYLNVVSSVTPQHDMFRPNESRGTLAAYYRNKVIKEWSEFEGEGPLDVYALPLLLNMAVKGGVTVPITPTGATTTRLWQFAPTMNADDLKSATLYWGDPNNQIFQSAFAMLDEFGFQCDASGNDGATMSIKGGAKQQSKVASPALPAQVNGPLITGMEMQLWIDGPAGTIGTTEILGRLISADFSAPTAISRKFLAKGPAGDKSFTRIGRGKRHAELKLVLELMDMAQYDLFVSGDACKTRLRLNGPKIETVAATDFYHYAQADIYGPLDSLGWGDLESTNRTIEVTIMSQYNATAGVDFALAVQSDRTTL